MDDFIDRTARRPSGWVGRLGFGNPWNHYRAFRLALERLALTPCDVHLEIGCGGGVLLERALGIVPRAHAIDASPDMVALARKRNRRAIVEGRAEIAVGDAEALPYPDATFTSAVATEMFFFIEHPDQMLAEARRVLRPGGRFALTTMPSIGRLNRLFLGPYASAMHLYDDARLAELLEDAGFTAVEVVTHDLFHQVAYGERPAAGA
ncbi:MAG: class I SAM-dependent methyltransferase [Myxococcales bacterium]|nr:class I SAM-dependent methyltransferase [Myxococcales bacterium]